MSNEKNKQNLNEQANLAANDDSLQYMTALNTQYSNASDHLTDIAKTLRDISKKNADNSEYAEQYNGFLMASKTMLSSISKQISSSTGDAIKKNKLAKEYIGYTSEEIKMLTSKDQVMGTLNDLQKRMNEAKELSNKFSITGYNFTKKEQEINDELLRDYGFQIEDLDEIDKLSGSIAETIRQFGKIDDVVKRNVELRKSIELEEKEKDLLEKVTGEFAESIKYIKEGNIGMGATLAAAFAIEKAGDGIHKLFSKFKDDGQALGQSFESIGKSMNGYALLGVNTSDAVSGLQDTLGDLSEVNSKLVSGASKLSLLYGISAKESGEVIGKLEKFPGFTEESAINTANMAAHLAEASKVSTGKVLQDLSKNSNTFAKFAKDGGANVVSAVVAAHKLGVEFANIAGATEKLLDFENSLNAQYEASILTGREINLDKARQLEINGDILGATKEIVKQVGTEAEFNNMLVPQRQAMADAMGMSVEDLGTLIQNQSKLNDLTAEQKEHISSSADLMHIMADAGSEHIKNASKLGGILLKNLPIIMAIQASGKKNLINSALELGAKIVEKSVLLMGPFGVAAGAALATGAVGYYMGKAQDGVIDPKGGLVVSGPKGAIQLDPNDSLVAGTNLGGNNKSKGSSSEIGHSHVLDGINRLISLVEKGQHINIDGRKIGEAITLSTPKNQFVSNRPV